MQINVLSYNFHRHFANFEQRKPALDKLLNAYEFDILCAQEFIPSNWKQSLFSKLTNFGIVDTFMNPIFYNKSKFTKVEHIQLKHNKFVALKLQSEKSQFVVCNLHLNYGYYKLNESTRIKQLTGYLNELSKFNSEGFPCIITGDFNCLPTASTLELLHDYKNTYMPGSLKESTLNDYSEIDNGEIIDHTFVKDFDVLSYKIVSELYNDIIPSDHYPIYSCLNL